MNSGSTSRDRSAAGAGNQKPESHGLFRSPHDALLARVRPREPQSFHVAPALSLPMDDQALSYYSRNYIEAPHALSGIMDGHLQCALVDGCYSQPQSILSLAIFAVSYATYGRARRSHAALATGYTKVCCSPTSLLFSSTTRTRSLRTVSKAIMAVYSLYFEVNRCK